MIYDGTAFHLISLFVCIIFSVPSKHSWNTCCFPVHPVRPNLNTKRCKIRSFRWQLFERSSGVFALQVVMICGKDLDKTLPIANTVVLCLRRLSITLRQSNTIMDNPPIWTFGGIFTKTICRISRRWNRPRCQCAGLRVGQTGGQTHVLQGRC